MAREPSIYKWYNYDLSYLPHIGFLVKCKFGAGDSALRPRPMPKRRKSLLVQNWFNILDLYQRLDHVRYGVIMCVSTKQPRLTTSDLKYHFLFQQFFSKSKNAKQGNYFHNFKFYYKICWKSSQFVYIKLNFLYYFW